MRIVIREIGHWKIKRDALNIGILTLVTVIIWVGIEVYQTYNQTTISQDIQSQLQPLNPSIDIETLDGLSDRFVPPTSFQITSPTDTTTPSPTPHPKTDI